MENEIFTELQPEQKPKKKRRVLWIFLPILWVLTIACAVVFTVLFTKLYEKNRGDVLTDSLKEAVRVIRENYYFYDADEAELTDAALKGVLDATGDDYAYYYNADEYAELTKQNEGAFVGIGVLTTKDEDGKVRIIEVYENTPASEAGILPDDIMIEINGVSYEGLDLSAFLNNMIAEDGAENTIEILRGDEELCFTIVAREVHSPSVSYRMLTDTIGYLRVSTFHGTCVKEAQDALKELSESGMQSLVFDLRDNLGGSLYDALDIADLFLPKDRIITSHRSRTDEEKKYYTKPDGISLPMVLLVNGYSASASELVAGALKDYEAAYLIGTTTYGKGIVQSYFSVPETGGMFKITTEAYYTPNGICVHGTGIEPDMTVTLPDEAQRYSISALPIELDAQLHAAIAYLNDK